MFVCVEIGARLVQGREVGVCLVGGGAVCGGKSRLLGEPECLRGSSRHCAGRQGCLPRAIGAI